MGSGAKTRGTTPIDASLDHWAPWWNMRLGDRIPANKFRPIPRVDAALLTVTRREPPLLPATMARSYAQFVRQHWPFGQ